MSDALNTAEAVVDILGGTRAVAKLTGRSDPAVSNWRKANSFPANTYLTLKFVLGRDLVRTPSNAFAANLAAVAGNEAKHFAMAFAAEAAVTVAHDANSEDWPMPQSE